MADDGDDPSRVGARVQVLTWTVIGSAVVLVLTLFSVQGPHGEEGSRSDYPKRSVAAEPAPVLKASRPLGDDYWPCSGCHDGSEPVNRERRTLEDDHDDLKLAHGDLWCLQCHDADQRDRLRLADGAGVEFTESWRLCTQCHGTKLRDWQTGVHGKRTGHWNGPKEYWTCVECHDPHSPVFKPLAPKPPPQHPTQAEAPPAPATPPASEGEHS